MPKRWISLPLPSLELTCLRFRFHQKVVILSEAIPPTTAETGGPPDRFRLRLRIPNFYTGKVARHHNCSCFTSFFLCYPCHLFLCLFAYSKHQFQRVKELFLDRMLKCRSTVERQSEISIVGDGFIMFWQPMAYFSST